jgi:hypothetical protein
VTRVFKTAWFAKAAGKASLPDADLCAAIREVMQGQADDLGGGVFKKRPDQNRRRSIVLAKGGRLWVYVYLFAKQGSANISATELADFRALAELYNRKTDGEIAQELALGVLKEICDGDGPKIQKRRFRSDPQRR